MASVEYLNILENTYTLLSCKDSVSAESFDLYGLQLHLRVYSFDSLGIAIEKFLTEKL